MVIPLIITASIVLYAFLGFACAKFYVTEQFLKEARITEGEEILVGVFWPGFIIIYTGNVCGEWLANKLHKRVINSK